MTLIKRRDDKRKYHILEPRCLGYKCFNPGIYQHRGASGGGSKNSGQSAMCLTMAYQGCPMDVKFCDELAKERKKIWRVYG